MDSRRGAAARVDNLMDRQGQPQGRPCLPTRLPTLAHSSPSVRTKCTTKVGGGQPQEKPPKATLNPPSGVLAISLHPLDIHFDYV